MKECNLDFLSLSVELLQTVLYLYMTHNDGLYIENTLFVILLSYKHLKQVRGEMFVAVAIVQINYLD